MNWRCMPGMLGAALVGAHCDASARQEYLSRLHEASFLSACSTPSMTLFAESTCQSAHKIKDKVQGKGAAHNSTKM